eukprot:365567-Chlamydomonas_euryale.AAC.2
MAWWRHTCGWHPQRLDASCGCLARYVPSLCYPFLGLHALRRVGAVRPVRDCHALSKRYVSARGLPRAGLNEASFLLGACAASQHHMAYAARRGRAARAAVK